MKISIEIIITADLNAVWSAWNNSKRAQKWGVIPKKWRVVKISDNIQEDCRIVLKKTDESGNESSLLLAAFPKLIGKRRIEYLTADKCAASAEFTAVENGVRMVEISEIKGGAGAWWEKREATLNKFAKHIETEFAKAGKTVPSIKTPELDAQ